MMMLVLIESIGLAAAAWLITFALHSTAFLGSAWLLSRWKPLQGPGTQDALWKTAVVGGVLTASLHVFGGFGPGLATWAWPTAEPALARMPSVEPPVVRETGTPMLAGEQAYRGVALGAAQPATAPASPLRGGEMHPIAGGVRWAAEHWQPLLLTLWMLMAGGLLMRRLRQRRRFMQHLGPRHAVVDEQVEAQWRHIVATSGASPALKRRARLTMASGLTAPIAFGRGEVCIPERVLTDLAPTQQQSVLAHEWAHHLRRDPWWLLALQWTEALFFFQPLLRVARRQQSEAAEALCDAWAADRVGSRYALAQSLVTVASWLHEPTPAWASSMAAKGSPLTQRVKHLLADPADAVRDLPLALRTGLVVGMILAIAVAVPGIALQRSSVSTPQLAPHTAIRVVAWQGGEGATYQSFTLTWSEDGVTTSVQVRDVQFEANYSRLLDILPTGYFEAVETGGPVERRLRIAEPAAARLRTYTVGGVEQAFDREAQRWVETLLRHIERRLVEPPPPPPRPALREVAPPPPPPNRHDQEALPPPPPPPPPQGQVEPLPPPPPPAVAPVPHAPGSETGHHDLRLTFTSDGVETSVRGEGVMLRATQPQVALVDDDSYLRISEMYSGGKERYLRITRPGSAFRYDYRLNGEPQPYDTAAQKWLDGVVDRILDLTAAKAQLHDEQAALVRAQAKLATAQQALLVATQEQQIAQRLAQVHTDSLRVRAATRHSQKSAELNALQGQIAVVQAEVNALQPTVEREVAQLEAQARALEQQSDQLRAALDVQQVRQRAAAVAAIGSQGTMRHRFERNGQQVRVTLKGDVRIGQDGTIRRLRSGNSIRVEEGERWLEYRRDVDGGIVRSYGTTGGSVDDTWADAIWADVVKDMAPRVYRRD